MTRRDSCRGTITKPGYHVVSALSGFGRTRNKRFVFFLYDETYISTRKPTEAEATL